MGAESRDGGLGYKVQHVALRLGVRAYSVRALADKQQFWDPDGEAARRGISSAQWPLFGMVWPAGVALARHMADFPIVGKRILEIGCGLGLASMVLSQRSANITASDYHPLAGDFLQHNTELNGLDDVSYRYAPWGDDNATLGRFDLIIGSDVLYERDHVDLLAAFVQKHANNTAQVILTDPGREQCGRFGKQMQRQGYIRTDTKMAFSPEDTVPYRGRLMSFLRR